MASFAIMAPYCGCCVQASRSDTACHMVIEWAVLPSDPPKHAPKAILAQKSKVFEYSCLSFPQHHDSCLCDSGYWAFQRRRLDHLLRLGALRHQTPATKAELRVDAQAATHVAHD